MPKKSLASAIKSKRVTSPPHVVVQALAGTGKTTTLIEGLKELYGQKSKLTPSPQQRAVWDAICESRGTRSAAFVAFNKSIATELQQRVPNGVEASTMHSMGLKIVSSAYGRVKVSDWVVQDIISEITGVDIRELRKKEFELIRGTDTLVGLVKVNLTDTDPDSLDLLTSYYEIELNGSRDRVYELVPQVIERCKDVTRNKRIDYNDMIWLPVILDLPAIKYDLLMVDECQDLNRCQQALAKKCGHRLILCGDSHQAIYGFAGADAQSMERMVEELSASPQGCKVLPLTVTRRCGKAIVEEAKAYVPEFEAHEHNSDGIISQALYKSETDSTTASSNLTSSYSTQTTKGTYHDRVEDGDMCLCRVNAPLVSQCFRFLKAGRKAEIQGRDVGKGLISTINKMNVETVPDLMEKLSDWVHQEVEKENRKRIPQESKIISIQDRFDCLVCFMEGLTRTEEVIERIERVFTDNRESPGIMLSSIHKAKGLEAKRVFLLEPNGATVPHPMAKSEWQRQQEWNLRYVAITRAIEELVYVSEK